jgi:acyl-CoA thioesterase YciA
MPSDTNPAGDIFGGWLMSQMDIAGGTLAGEACRGRVVTIAVDSIKFIKPVKVGDVICCYGEIVKIGTTSVTIKMDVWIRGFSQFITEASKRYKVTEASFTYVAIDQNGNKRPIKK